MKVKITEGGLKFALFIDKSNGAPVRPESEYLDALLAIPGAEEAGSTHCQTCKVVFGVAIEEFTPELVQQKADAIREVMARFKNKRSEVRCNECGGRGHGAAYCDNLG